MTQTYDPTALATSNRDRVRFEISDTEVTERQAFLEDEEIDSVLSIESDNLGAAVVACIDYIIGKLSRPDYRVDWLSVSAQKDAADSYRLLRLTKARQFGIGGVSTISTHTLRQDSYDYSEAT